MNLVEAKRQAEISLREFVGQELTTEVLNEIENRVNGLVYNWAHERFAVLAPFGPQGGQTRQYPIKGIKIKYSEFNGGLEFSFRY